MTPGDERIVEGDRSVVGAITDHVSTHELPSNAFLADMTGLRIRK